MAVDVIYAADDRFRVALPLPPGRYRARKYVTADEELGIMVTLLPVQP